MSLVPTLTIVLSLAACLLLAFYLIRVIVVLRCIVAKLANARLLLLVVAKQTEPVGPLVGGIGENVTSLHTLVRGVGRSLGLSGGGSR